MTTTVASFIVILLGMLICFGSAFGIYAPTRLMDVVEKVWGHKSGMYLAVVSRLVLGVALLAAAPDAGLPAVFRVIGWLSIIAAIAIPIIGREKIGGLIRWLGSRPGSVVRLWLLVGLALGGVLVFGVLGGTS